MKYFVAGHNGMVGSAILSRLVKAGHSVVVREKRELDLTDQSAVKRFFNSEKPDIVIVAAGKVGGILANNNFPADFLLTNVMIASNIISCAFENNVSKLMMLSSSCVYPREAPQPINEGSLLTGILEPTNEPYAIAKIAAMKLCESYNRQHGTDFRSVMPCNLYGPNDNFEPLTSHVLPALIRRFHEAKVSGASEVVIWGTGQPLREFLHVADLADAVLFLIGLSHKEWRSYVPERNNHVNIGTGVETSIGDLAILVSHITGYGGKLTFDTTKPDGTFRKLLDVDLLKRMGWQAKIPLEAGIKDTYREFLQHHGGRRV